MQTVDKKHLPAVRWEILRTLDVGGHLGATETMLLSVVGAAFITADRQLVRDEMHYLEDRKLISVERHEIDPWRAVLTRHGRDLVDYQIPCEPGIRRPPPIGG